MNIVYTDAYTLNPGDLDWGPITTQGNVTLYDRTAPEQLLERVADAELVLTNKVRFDRATLSQLPNLRYIGVTATGYDIIDVAAAREQGITVTNVKGYGSDAVAQHTFALLLELSNHVGLHNQSVKAGEWVNAQDWCYWKNPLMELTGKTLGLVGYGDIGQKVAEIGRAFGMNIIVHRRQTETNQPIGIQYVDLSALFDQSDVVSLHCPATAENTGFVNKTLLQQMKPTAFLINTSRGKLINEQDLADALDEGILAGAALDVVLVEPPVATNPLITAKNCLLTPHIAWASKESRQRLLFRVAENMAAFLAGSPSNVVS